MYLSKSTSDTLYANILYQAFHSQSNNIQIKLIFDSIMLGKTIVKHGSPARANKSRLINQQTNWISLF